MQYLNERSERKSSSSKSWAMMGVAGLAVLGLGYHQMETVPESIELFDRATNLNAFVPTGQMNNQWVSFNSVNYPNRFIRHRGFEAWLDDKAGDDLYQMDSTFQLVPGICGAAGTVSFRSWNYGDRYLRHLLFALYLHPNDIWLLKDDACFYPEWSAVDGMLRYKSKNFQDRFLRHAGFRLWIHPNDGSQLFKEDSAWKMVWGNKASTDNLPDFLNPKPTVEDESEPAFDFSNAKLLSSSV